ncbi:methionine aminopeptidase [Methanosarcina sp. 2.H.T.1A.6]|uniref:type II methionyl aminopeptidase n=1 Tax=unclassified Methanosarcina TaxID=2644672 RepID=UPI0006210406|nr:MULTISPECIES: type II methionyl aminopeptidase [unclassified Methanosarcina]KKG16291.1 methionine aminopeptidase [Methanosarcina sp. 2.H.T.1A.3]KKG22358.1 methionine aminopeptidase [Methanosarcina sp. 2.H.T.1A.15]KKG22989.1 methionine aminopeptidase [Methanosarcina sp. 2.H.T.1A.6]KKG26212.1 methionine aminopeptidase [Methanosarcina sp. 2.H.T.1A.8]
MTDNVYNREDIHEKYREAGRILKIVRTEAVDMVRVGNSLLEVAEFVEKKTIELGGRPAFPCNISRNQEAAHATPKAGDKDVFGKDIVKLDLGVHVDGYIADSAVTVDLSGNSDLVKASEEALAAAIDLMKPGVGTGEIGAAIEESIRSYGLNPIMNLTGHGLSQYEAHDNPSVPNKHVEGGVVLKEGDVLAIEPFATNGTGFVHDGSWAEIYSLIRKKPVRLPAIRNVLKQVEEYRELPFAKRWLNSDKLEFSLIQLEKAGIIHSYPVLIESAGGLVSQAEHTVIITQDGCEVTTK